MSDKTNPLEIKALEIKVLIGKAMRYRIKKESTLENCEASIDTHLACTIETAMTNKLALARSKGRGGWWRDDVTVSQLKVMLLEHIEKGDMLDVVNLAAMIYVKEAMEINTNEQ